MHENNARRSTARVDDWGVPKYLLGRIYLISALLLVEYTIIVSIPHTWCHMHRAVAGAIVLAAVFLFLGRKSLRQDHAPLPLNVPLLVAYGLSLAVTACTHFLLLTRVLTTLLVSLWFAAILLSAVTLFFAFVPFRRLPSILKTTRVPLAYAAIAAALAMALSDQVQLIWNAPQTWAGVLLQRTTFRLVGQTLSLFYPNVIIDPANFTVFLPNFAAMIAGTCSGIEGLALTFLFCSGWLWYSRRELRFPHALLLLPCALSLIFALNILRIVLLLVIGNAGHPDMALNGFHSEAGWIAFNTVSLGMLAVADRLPWLARHPRPEAPAATVPATRNIAAIYLLPFLTILAAGFISRAGSASAFERFYTIRFLAVAVVFWLYRAEYRRISWRFSWRGPAVGAVIFAMWIALSRWTGGAYNDQIGAALANLSPVTRFAWLAIRIIAAVITVPVAEELAFRGFLLRRIMSVNVESVAYKAVTPIAVLLSSLAFGVMHGKLWVAGTVAGIAYALLAKRTNRLGEAVAAHATTNLMLAAWVLATGQWGLW